jgi:hypothetical protein
MMRNAGGLDTRDGIGGGIASRATALVGTCPVSGLNPCPPGWRAA